MGCNVDRIPTPCTVAQRWEASGVAVPCENNDCDPQPQRDDDGKPNGWKVPMGGGYWVSNGEKPDLPEDAFIFPDEVEWRDGGDWASWAMSFNGGNGKKGRRRPVDRKRGGRRHRRSVNPFEGIQGGVEAPPQLPEIHQFEYKNGLSPVRCASLRTLLDREAKYGTWKAARMSSFETGGETKLIGLANYFGPIVVNRLEIDLDWLVTLYAANMGTSTVPVYGAGKLLRTWSNIVNGVPLTNPVPFQERGEANAVKLAIGESRLPFSAIFNPVWMKENCPPDK